MTTALLLVVVLLLLAVVAMWALADGFPGSVDAFSPAETPGRTPGPHRG